MTFGRATRSGAPGKGFLPRFLICEPPSAIGTRLHAQTRRDDGALGGFADRLRAVLAEPMPMDPETRELSPRVSRKVSIISALMDDPKLKLRVPPRGTGTGTYAQSTSSILCS